MIAYESVDFPDPFGPMIACTSFRPTSRSTPFTISVPSSSATWMSSSFSNPTSVYPFSAKAGLLPRKSASSLAEEPRAPIPRGHDFNGSCDDGSCGGGGDEAASEAQRRPERRGPRAVVEAAVRARVPGERLEEVVGRADRLVLAGVLAAPGHAPQHQVAG